MAMANPQRFHGAVEQAFPGERRRRLWRLDPLGGRLYLLILSEDWPALSGIEEQFGCGEPGETKDYTPLLERIATGTVWRFRLTANPTVSRPAGRALSERGRVQAHITPEFQEKWLRERAEDHGFLLKDMLVTGSRWLRFQKKPPGKPCHLAFCDLRGSVGSDGSRRVPPGVDQGPGARKGLRSRAFYGDEGKRLPWRMIPD